MADFVPHRDPSFTSWSSAYNASFSVNAVGMGFTDAQAQELQALFAAWEAAFIDHKEKENQARAATASKDAARIPLATKIREFSALIQAKSSIPDSIRLELGLPIHSNARTAKPVPVTRPIVLVDRTNRLQHTIRVVDESTSNSRRRPFGAIGYQLWCKLGDPIPGGIVGCQYLGTFISPHVQIYEAAEGGKTVHYLSRWVNGKGIPGPLSATVSATISA
jgi:hypothetical protein